MDVDVIKIMNRMKQKNSEGNIFAEQNKATF